MISALGTAVGFLVLAAGFSFFLLPLWLLRGVSRRVQQRPDEHD